MEEAFFGIPVRNKKWNTWHEPKKEEPKLPVVCYTPPDNVDAIIRKGQYVCGVPVWDNNTALKALDRILALAMQYISKANTRNIAYNPEVDLEKFFELCNKSRGAMEVLQRLEEENNPDKENKTPSTNK